MTTFFSVQRVGDAAVLDVFEKKNKLLGLMGVADQV
jgi:hypothetical protein